MEDKIVSLMDYFMVYPNFYYLERFLNVIYNANSIVNNHAGALLSHHDFRASKIFQQAEILIHSDEIKENAKKLGKMLESQDGIETIINNMK